MGKMKSVSRAISLPFTLAHEFTHFLVAFAATREAKMAFTVYEQVEIDGERYNPGAVTGWPAIESTPIRVFAHLSPTVFGLVLMGLWAWNGINLDGWRFVMALGLAFYTLPSFDDIRGALGRQEHQETPTDDPHNTETDAQHE